MSDREWWHCFATSVHPPHDWLSGNVLYHCPGISSSIRWIEER